MAVTGCKEPLHGAHRNSSSRQGHVSVLGLGLVGGFERRGSTRAFYVLANDRAKHIDMIPEDQEDTIMKISHDMYNEIKYYWVKIVEIMHNTGALKR